MISVIGNRGGTFLRAAMSEGAEDGVVSVIGGGGLAESSITFPYTGPEVVDQQNVSSNVTISAYAVWQSFTAGVDGYLSSFATCHLYSRTLDFVRVYKGGVEPLYETTGIRFSSGWNRIRPEYPVELVAGQKYSIYLQGSNGVSWRARNADVYPGGRASISAGYDMTFQIFTPDI